MITPPPKLVTKAILKDKFILWFGYWSEVIAFISLMMILFATFVASSVYSTPYKVIVVIVGAIVIYDVFKPFVYTNYILIKES